MSKKRMASYSLWIGVLSLAIGFGMVHGFPAFFVSVGVGGIIQSMVLFLD